jgi:hypothetical protein
LLAKPTPHNVNHDNDRFSMFNKKRDITDWTAAPLLPSSSRAVGGFRGSSVLPLGSQVFDKLFLYMPPRQGAARCLRPLFWVVVVPILFDEKSRLALPFEDPLSHLDQKYQYLRPKTSVCLH